MKYLSRVVWSEGMHLGPHHFQTQSRYFEDTLWFLNSSFRSEPWGLLNFSLDAEALRNGQADLHFASGIMPDGLIFDMPDCDSIPSPIKLSSVFPSTESEIVLHLTVPARQDQGLDCDASGGASTRYTIEQRRMRDDAAGKGEFDVVFAKKNLVLATQSQLAKDAASFPLARIVRDGNGGFVCDPEFIPPSLRIGASESLVLLLHKLVQAMNERVTATREARHSSGGLELGTSALDVANYWFLHALCSSLPALRHHLQDRRSHPEDVYRDLARLAGALNTFSTDSGSDEIPPYRHRDLTSTFKQLDSLIRRYLELVAPSNTVTLQFTQASPDSQYIHVADVRDERCVRRSRWVFGIRSSIPDSSMLRRTPALVKICSAEWVGKLVERALPGMELRHLPVPPTAMRAQADMHYFAISQSGPCWDHILRTRQVGVYLPGDLGDATFELTIVLEN